LTIHCFNVALFLKQNLSSTDTPRALHLTSEPLLEEFAIAAQFWRLRPADQSELCRNSVLISGFPEHKKVEWLGESYYLPGSEGNKPLLSAIPDIRAIFRREALRDERDFIQINAQQDVDFPNWSA
jgi:AMP deaminase